MSDRFLRACLGLLAASLTACMAVPHGELRAADDALLVQWPLAGDAVDRGPNGLALTARGASLDAAGPRNLPRTAAAFDGRGAHFQVRSEALRLGASDFTVSLWVNAPDDADDLPGDLISHYDPTTRRGWILSLKTNSGVTTNQSNARHLQFGIDQDRGGAWTDRGRPGHALLAFALCVHDGVLYAGTCEPGEGESGRVYRFEPPNTWTLDATLDGSNAVTALASHQGRLYAATGKYRVAGSALPESPNALPGGRVFRREPDGTWTPCGQLPETEAIGGLAVFQGRLFASSLYRPAGFFRFEDRDRWIRIPTLENLRTEALGVWNGHLYATCYDGGRVFRFDGETWTDCGQLAENTQTYSIAVYEGKLHVGTWPSGRVYRFEDVGRWTDVGRLGGELEVMGMLVHNGRLIAGTLPLAEVHSLEADGTWKRLAQLDATPDVKYRRAWTMAEFQGEVFCSTLPSGRVFSWSAGRSVAWDRTFPPGWHHVAAVRQGKHLRLYVDRKEVAVSAPFEPAEFDLSHDAPLRLGAGPNDTFLGRIAQVRIDRRALTPEEIQQLP